MKNSKLGRPYVYGEEGAVTMAIRIPLSVASAIHSICRETHVPLAELVRAALSQYIKLNSRKANGGTK